MRYLTREWYDLCQQTHLHFGMRVHRGAQIRDEVLYLRLYKRKEKEFINLHRDVYNVDPRYMLEGDGAVMIPVEQFVSGDIRQEDTIIYHMPEDEKEEIQKKIAEYNARPPFDVVNCKQEFKDNLEWSCADKGNQLPSELLAKIADIRVFSLGYCTQEVMRELKKLSNENKRKMEHISNEYVQMQQSEDIPQHIRSRFGFHDCQVTEILFGKDMIIRLETRSGFTDFNKITLVAAETIKQEGQIVGSYWIYDELYRTGRGYEVHIIFSGAGDPQCIIRCEDIIIKEE
ncbi:DUF4085 family protein [Bacillales bacterium AN1005]